MYAHSFHRIGIQTQTWGYNVLVNPREAHEPHSFLDMDDSEEDSVNPTAGHSAFSDYDSEEDTDDDDLLMDTQSSTSTNSSSLPSPSACIASAGHSFWDDEPQSGDDYWDRQSAMLCAKHIRDAFPDAVPRGKLSIEQFIADVLKRTRGSVRDDAAFVALQFLKRLAPSCPLGYFEDMFFISLILADKVRCLPVSLEFQLICYRWKAIMCAHYGGGPPTAMASGRWAS
jgi:hypothetical protein